MLTFLAAPSKAQEACAIVSATGQRIPAQQLLETADAIQTFCDSAQLQTSHRIGVVLDNCWQHPLLTLVLANTCSVMPINPALTDFEILELAREANLSALLAAHGDTRVQDLCQSLLCPFIKASLENDRLNLSIEHPLSPVQAKRPSGMVLMTSGTTGMPKRVPITLDAMLLSARNIAETLHLTSQDRAVHALPMFHIGAVVDLFLAPLLAGGSVAISKGQTPEDLHDAVENAGGTWMQLVPTMLARCVDDLSNTDRSLWGDKLRFIRSVSSDLSVERHAASEAAFGDLPIIQMYGMSETAGQICSNPLPPKTRTAGAVGAPIGVDVQLLDSVGAPVPTGSIGEVCVAGPTVMAGYEGIPNETTFWSDWLRTGDLGQFNEDGILTLTGRVKEMINRGGEKVSPLEVERAILSLEGVSEAAAYGKQHPTLGEQVGLSVILSHQNALSEANLLSHLQGQLAEHKRPRSIDIRDSFPKLASGKINRLALSNALADATETTQIQSPTAKVLSELWQKVLATAPPHEDEDFFDAGGDSLQATTFLSALEKKLGTPVDPNLLYEAPRFGALVATLEQQTPQSEKAGEPSYLEYLRKALAGWKGARLGPHKLIIGQRMMGKSDPVFLITQGEHASLLKLMNPDRPAYLMRSLFGLMGKSDEITQQLAQIYADDIQQIHPEGPLNIVGFCEGAKLAHFIAEHLARVGRHTDLIVSIDYDWPRVWNGAVLHVQSEDWDRFKRPELGLAHLTTGGADVLKMQGRHIEALDGPSTSELGTKMESLFSGEASLPLTAEPSALDIRQSLYHAKIAHALPRTFRPDHAIHAPLTITNMSKQDWHPTAQSGISIIADLYNLDGHLRQCVAGYCELTETLKAGESAVFQMTIDLPKKWVPMRLKLSMADEGICRFLKGPDSAVSHLIFPRPFG